MSQPSPYEGNKQQQQQGYRHQAARSSLQTSTQGKQHYHRMSTSSEEEATNQAPKDNTWQTVRNTKRRKVNQPTSPHIAITNKYSQLNVEEADENNTTKPKENKIPRPPPIFVYGVTNYKDMVHTLSTIVEQEQYTTKTLIDNTIKINSNTPDTYRRLIRYMRENQIIHHTYQPKEDRAFRIVIKHLHFTTNPQEIEHELNKHGHKVRNILNARSRITREPLNLFFVDLEPATNNKEIYKLDRLYNQTIEIEPPRRAKGIPQCMRCQQYGHTRSYCNKPYACVKCGGSHSTQSCTKSKNTPAKCVLCGGAHPANYRGCEHYHNIIKQTHNNNNRLNIQRNVPIQSQLAQIQPGTSYSEALKGQRNQKPIIRQEEATGNTTNEPNSTNTLTKILEEFKVMFQQLTQQNSMILNMLSTLISKIN
jgi:hypothetical protein